MVMHMVQHVLLLDIAPILMILGLTKVLLRPVTRRLQTVERRAGWLAHPAFAVVAYVGFMWLWHVPAIYDVALRHTVSTRSSTSASPSPAACTGGTCSRRSAAACGSAAWARSCT